MNVQTNLTRSDIIQTNSILVFRYKFVWALIVGAWFFVFITINNSEEYWASSTCRSCAIFGMFATATSIACLIPVFYLVVIILCALLITKEAGILGNHFYSLSDEGLFEKTEVNESLMRWSGIKSLIRTKKYIIIRFPVGAYVLPKRDFTDETQFDKFWEFLSNKWKANRK